MKGRNDDFRSARFISASEVSKYVFCNVAWYLDKEGAPRNRGSGVRMQKGIKSHSTLKRRYNATRAATYAVVAIMLIMIGYIFTILY